MSNLDEPNDSGGSSANGTPAEQMSRSDLETRVRELERENAQLKLDIEVLNIRAARDRQLLDALAVAGIPIDPREMEELKATSTSLSQLLGELEQPEQTK